MKKLVFATLMCVAAMSASAQVLTSETVNNVYEEVTNKADGDFAFNAEMTGKDITTMYVYKIANDRRGAVMLKPHLKYDYSYAADGRLTSRVTSCWSDIQGAWTCAARHDYTLDNGSYCVEYSHYNHTANCFDKPIEKMVYLMTIGNDFDYVSYYYRENPSSDYKLVSETYVTDMPNLLAVN